MNYEGEIQFSTESEEASSTECDPLPASWVDSIIPFQTAPMFTSDELYSAMTALTEWPAEPGGAFWGMECVLN